LLANIRVTDLRRTGNHGPRATGERRYSQSHGTAKKSIEANKPGRGPTAGKTPTAARPSAADKRPAAQERAQPETTSAQALLALYRPDLAADLEALGSPLYRYAQVLEHLVRRSGFPISTATSLPSDLRQRLSAKTATLLTECARISSSDGATKLLLKATDGTCVETVIIHEGRRVTVCVSTQAGCRVGCVFCATGALGFSRNLSTGEIVDQILASSSILRQANLAISNVVYMGMGEPLLNFQASVASIQFLTDPRSLGLSRRSISVSTVGIPSGIRRLARALPQVNLAISLHAADDQLRARLIPSRFRHPVSEILDAAWEHFELTHRKLLIEYVLLAGINDDPNQAARLARLLRGHVVSVNLLALNESELIDSPMSQGPTARCGDGFERSLAPASASAIRAFKRVLQDAGIEAVVRKSRGDEIQAACGQLAGQRGSYQSSSE
jgi:23S rRNA (adenine2503-C2)-methyltransferase